MVEVCNGIRANACNSCRHRCCCKYVDDIQKVVKEMSIIRQLDLDGKVFELYTEVIFRCDNYLEEKWFSATTRDVENKDEPF